jgi:hypothetical protein
MFKYLSKIPVGLQNLIRVIQPKSSIPMTDQLFQRNFVEPLIHSNYNLSKSIGQIKVNEESPETWISSHHLATEHGLEKVYGYLSITTMS